MTFLPIPLSEGFISQVKPGDTVQTGQVLATRKAQKEIRISIPKAFSIPIKHSAKTLRRHPGDKVRRGDIVAARKKTFGMLEDVIVSDVDGILLRYEREHGVVVILPHTPENESDTKQEESIICPIDGVVELCDNDKILLKTEKDVLYGASGIGGDVTGQVHSISESFDTPEGKVQLHFLDSAVIGKVVLGGVFDRDTLLKAIGMGVSGVIAYSIREEDLEHIQIRQLRTPIISVNKEDFVKLTTWHTKNVFMQGTPKTILLLHI